MRQFPGLLHRSSEYGFTLIELMISMAIGMLLIISAMGVYLATSQSYRTVGQVRQFQEGVQVAFEMMARDIRGATFSPCDAHPEPKGTEKVFDPVKYTLITTGWPDDWNKIVFGQNGAVEGEQADRIQVIVPTGVEGTVKVRQSSSDAQLQLDQNPFHDGDMLVVCNYTDVFRFRAGDIGGAFVGHPAKAGNCSSIFEKCGGGNTGAAVVFDKNAMVAAFEVREWFVAKNDRGGRSLFRRVNGGASLEILAGVKTLEFSYFNPNRNETTFLSASSIGSGVSDWEDVKAVRMRLVMEQERRRMSREFSNTVSIRSRSL